ncbi:hypothetical protein LTR62_005672 [Meristemomyces frigidus]|uniref:Oxysterol-binding protein n=1 Tax=Meristemomyces frigidus TaxID=1508187 RepID=A0AAN7TDU8_9PEZI|nr:hypothetical protein LTR62_005672 [Meristemomyces frigidus]
MYARGILFGKMKYELGDHAVVRCPETGLEADIEFKVKGWMGGTYNAIGGNIKDSKTGKSLFELSGLWNEEMYIKDLATGKKELFFDAKHSKPSFPKARPLNEQSSRESQKLWDTTTRAIKKADQKTATDEKSRIEDEQRREAAERGEETSWQPKLFKAAPPGDEQNLDWVINANIDSKAPPEQQIKQILAIAPILPGQGQEQQRMQPEQNQRQAQQGIPEQGRDRAPPQTQPQQTQQASFLPQQGAVPSQEVQQSSLPPLQGPMPPQQAQQQRGGDRIDFGQNDGSATALSSSTQANTTQPQARTLAQSQSQTLSPQSTQSSLADMNSTELAAHMGAVDIGSGSGTSTKPTVRSMRGASNAGGSAGFKPGMPLQRTDSIGNEETFVDAES